jgi:hypothetical protein
MESDSGDSPSSPDPVAIDTWRDDLLASALAREDYQMRILELMTSVMAPTAMDMANDGSLSRASGGRNLVIEQINISPDVTPDQARSLVYAAVDGAGEAIDKYLGDEGRIQSIFIGQAPSL